jgi:hypothetical protein
MVKGQTARRLRWLTQSSTPSRSARYAQAPTLRPVTPESARFSLEIGALVIEVPLIVLDQRLVNRVAQAVRPHGGRMRVSAPGCFRADRVSDRWPRTGGPASAPSRVWLIPERVWAWV